MSEHSAEDKERAEKCEAVGKAVMAALEPFAVSDPSAMIIGTAAVLGAMIAATDNPTLSYSRATQAICGIMTGELLD